MLILAILLGAVGIVAGGWAYHLEQMEDEAEEVTIAELLAIVNHNQQILTDLRTNPAARPLAFDACAGTDIVAALRKQGVAIKPLEFEERCANAQAKTSGAAPPSIPPQP
jgi:nitrogen fixation-related uncharacterized protein